MAQNFYPQPLTLKALEVSTAVQGVAVNGHDNCHLWDHLAFRSEVTDSAVVIQGSGLECRICLG